MNFGENDVAGGRWLGPTLGACQRHRSPNTPDTYERCPDSKAHSTCERCLDPDPIYICGRYPDSKVSNTYERCLDADPTDICET